MFLFGKKDKKEKKAEEVPVINQEELMKQAEEKVQQLEGTQGDARIELLNETGSLYMQAREYDEAIRYYEESFEMKKVMGKSYTDLMSLYNKKRQQAAEAKDDEKITYYFGKVQEMMQISKDMIRGKI
ncbi:tetratricopeptide repeat protein [Faecalicatena orotica]|uniref:tetratricopeptide repeat protein n=1 Tax=Faecalicatena orotica TaxID=1544 RepID=UPI0032167508